MIGPRTSSMTARARVGVATRPRRPPRRVRLVADLGLFLLPALVVETLTGLVLFAFAHGLAPKGSAWADAVFEFLAQNNLLTLQDIGFQTDVHVWAGYLTIWAIALKAWASWPTLRGWHPRRFSALRFNLEKAAAWALLTLAPASYLTGTAIALRLFRFHDRFISNLHLWVSLLLLPVLAWHILRFLPLGLKVLRVQLKLLYNQR